MLRLDFTPSSPPSLNQELSDSYEEVSKQRDTLSLQEADHLARIRELEGDIQAMGEKMLQRETELDR